MQTEGKAVGNIGGTIRLEIESHEQKLDYEEILGPIDSETIVIVTEALYLGNYDLFRKIEASQWLRNPSNEAFHKKQKKQSAIMERIESLKQKKQEEITLPKVNETYGDNWNPFEYAKKRKAEEEKRILRNEKAKIARAVKIAAVRRRRDADREARERRESALKKERAITFKKYQGDLEEAFSIAENKKYRADGGDYVFCPSADDMVRMEASRTRPKECDYDGEINMESYRGPFGGLHQHHPLDFNHEEQLTVTQSSLGGSMSGDIYYDYK